jgi:hypothetical protein
MAFLVALPSFAGTISEEMNRIHQSYVDFFKDFPKGDPSHSGGSQSSQRQTNFHGSSTGPQVSGNYYNQVAKSNYEKQQIMQTLGTLASGLANSAGSAYAFDSSQKAAQQAAALSASTDPQFQQMGKLFQQESQQIAQNDRAGATNSANQIQAVPQPYVSPNYQPTQGESVIVQAFNFAVGGILSSLGGVLGGTAVAALLKTLGIGGGMGAGLSSAGYQTGSGVVNSAYNGQSASPALNNGAVGTINTGAGGAQGAINQVPQMAPPKNGTQGSALPGS